MLSLSCADPWTEGSVGLEEKVVTAAAQAEERDSVNSSISSCSNLDDSLTSLQWLQEFCILGANVPQHAHHQPHLFGHQQIGSDAPSSPLAGDPASIGMPLTPGKPTAAAYSRRQSLPGIVAHGHCPDEVDYKTNAHIKPPYSYATLICMAMQASKKSKITLSCIYKWITDNFCYYRHADPTWQNSIRHNLSLNKCFIKVPRQKDEPGKGGFWKIDPQYAERLLSGAYKKRRMPPVQINPALQNRLRLTLQPQSTGPCSTTGVQEGLCIKSESQQFLWEFEEATGADRCWDPHLAEGTMLGSWPVVRGRGGKKRKHSLSSKNGVTKVPRRSSSPLLSVDEQKEIGPLKGDFDWDALLDSALSGELSLEGGEPLSPIIKEEDLTVWGTHISPIEAPAGTADIHMLETQRRHGVSNFDEETILATAFLENPWPEEEQGRSDFLCSSTVNLDQLFDLEDSLGGDPSTRIDTLL
ncbi:forkhead box protein J1-A [Parambassis ranga]|uniref:Forkhead box protein J1-A-like n=1 Tax=Parambassis ranga TaxID=210632 RepID=A0A6P7IXE0_9TELE|nr:forkhead box protein J1-A-like [Parambassis ranga]XP_028268135.1 forkhead box protein J1-A-like [Parambassis ranga]XP_028268136.1 forkhead box protein J1-A-like [Parambassis ranga]